MKVNLTFRQFVSYAFVGLVSTIIDLIVYSLIINLGLFNSSNSKKISFLVGTINSFFFNKKLTFKSEKKYRKEFIKYIIIWGGSFLLNSTSHDISSIYFSGYFPFFIATSLSSIINFLGAKFIVFKK